METARLAPDSKTVLEPLQSSVALQLRFLHLLCEGHQSSTQVCRRGQRDGCGPHAGAG